MTSARDNFFKSCPAIMDYSTLTDYRQSYRREEYIRNINAIPSEHDYRLFLQENTPKILDAEWAFLKKEFGCDGNICIHNYPTRQPDGTHAQEMKVYNAVKTGKLDSSQFVCDRSNDYRLNYEQ